MLSVFQKASLSPTCALDDPEESACSLSLSLSLSFVKLNHLLTLLLLLAIFVESLIICVDAMSLNEVNSVN